MVLAVLSGGVLVLGLVAVATGGLPVADAVAVGERIAPVPGFVLAESDPAVGSDFLARSWLTATAAVLVPVLILAVRFRGVGPPVRAAGRGADRGPDAVLGVRGRGGAARRGERRAADHAGSQASA